eukprot:XP_016664089.1 PREDICTED: uncharacterized protein LOC107885120 [Acyrthosiphon pisum]
MDDSVKITKLSNAGNWPLCKFQMKVIFNSFELTSIITGEWKKPSSKITKTEKETDEEARARWHRSIIDWNRADVRMICGKNFSLFMNKNLKQVYICFNRNFLVIQWRRLMICRLIFPNAWDSIPAVDKTINLKNQGYNKEICQ